MVMSTVFGVSYAGSLEQIAPSPVAMVSSPVAKVVRSSWYIGGGIGGFGLLSEDSRELLYSKDLSLILGYQFNDYLSIEGRYAHSLGSIKYDHGKTEYLSRTLSNSSYQDLELLARFAYPFGSFSPYLLAGFGQSTITHIANANRSEKSIHYGVGLSYSLSDRLELFADYIRAYRGNGFDKRSTAETLHLDRLTTGIIYHF
jgi:outer membrane receptor protein involved in Fe transport